MKKKFSTEIDLFLAKSLKYRTNFDVVRRQIKIKRKNAKKKKCGVQEKVQNEECRVQI